MARQSRARRRRLRAHDKGCNRHNKGLAWIEKKQRQHAERSGARSRARTTESPPQSGRGGTLPV